MWLVTGYRAGERSQIMALAEALGWPFELKALSYRKSEFRTSLFRGSDLRGVRLQDSSKLTPPWPDLVISAGMRNEPVGRWIRDQSGGRTRLVHIGRPWAAPDRFDLVITTPQYRLAAHERVLQNAMPLNQVTPGRLAEQGRRLLPRVEDLPRPRIGVILGGNSGPYTLGPGAAARIAQQAGRMALQRNGSLLVSTSARTSQQAVQAFQRHIPVPHYLYRWRADDDSNPYFGILALSDELIVTADSISMLGEACATGKPLYMADLGGYGYPMRPECPAEVDFRLTGLTYSWLMRFGPRRLSRDIRLVHRQLLDTGRAVWLGQPAKPASGAGLSDMQRAVKRVRALFGYS
ncbi:MAG: mitochondrial fission ELM1 family protein [Thiogranum sp.]